MRALPVKHEGTSLNFVDFGRKKVLERSTLDIVPIHRGANCLSFDMLELHKQRLQTLARVLAATIGLFREGSITAPKLVTIKNVAELYDAVETFSESFTAGTAIIEYKKSDGLLKVLPCKSQIKLKADATYLLVGCLGSLGRSLSFWMIKRDARHFAFLSRSGADAKSAATLVKDIKATGVNLSVIRGDATNAADVECAVQSVPSQHPIAGVVHANMVLRRSLICLLSKCRAYRSDRMASSML